jgi:hypothetical protein
MSGTPIALSRVRAILLRIEASPKAEVLGKT